MKRTPIRPGKPLKRGPGPKRRTPIRPVNPTRRKKLYARNFGEHADVIRQLPCVVCGRFGVDPHHVKARGMGGCNSDKSSLVPLDRRCHDLLHLMGRPSFEARFEVDLEAEAAELWEQYSNKGEQS